MDYQNVIGQVMSAAAPHIGEGAVADYIPGLAAVDPKQFGIAVATAEGQVYGDGDVGVPFAIESISKVFALALVLSRKGTVIWDRVRREPSGMPFNDLIELELERGIPRNPYINPGAIVVADQLLFDTGDAVAALRDLFRAETGNRALDVDSVIAESELRSGERNRAIGYLMSSFGNMRNPVELALDHYFRQCSFDITCTELAKAGLLVARHGLRADGSRLLERADARHLTALMTTCGTYDAAGEFAYRVGLPCKSGVGGAILAVVPDRCSIAVWGPGLDPKGNSVTGGVALEAFARATGFSVF
ncbi:glutaminase [Nocardia sp. NBC_01503]|uniref:glutaminase n=1 Tax=Nocardia sp. NBC_01503 TaxID=2975997 RepID=UPI002E7BCAAA|nr:glutaminase [Nocardia sp. NBC_01503]WTL34218.1 glutaminase [Nocardia sp. NBC_01503]